jgi:hypothetical protein
VKTIAIYPDSWAEMNKERAGQKYRPSNGTEGAVFIDAYCAQCERDHGMMAGLPLEECDDNQICELIGKTYMLAVDHPDYPSEWQYGKDGQPCCTAFVPAGQPIPIKDEHTLDMFATSNENGQRGSEA